MLSFDFSSVSTATAGGSALERTPTGKRLRTCTDFGPGDRVHAEIETDRHSTYLVVSIVRPLSGCTGRALSG